MRSLTGRQGPCKSLRGGLLQGEKHGPIRHYCNIGGRVANLFRLSFAALLALFSFFALADGGAFPATPGEYNTTSCNSSTSAPSSVGGPAAWTCQATSNPAVQNCGWLYSNSGYFGGVCNIQKGPATCPAGANASTSPTGEPLCTCTAGLRPSNGQCVALPVCPDGQHEEGGACVPNSCQPNETRVNGVCVPEPACPAGQSRVNGVCKPFKCPAQGKESDQWYDLESSGVSSTCLYNSSDNTYCVLTVKPQVIAYKDGKPSYMGGYGVYTGGTCGPSEPGKPRPVDPKDPDGDPDKGTKPPGPNDPKPSDKPSGSGGGGSPGNSPSPPNPDGSCPAGTYKSGGQCYQKDPPPKPPDTDGKCPSGYVKVGDSCIPLMPPEDKEGDDKSSFGGQCDAVACEGDAIQCAIVRDQYKRSCELMEKESAESQLYTTNKGKEGNQTGDLPGNQTINMAGRIDTSDALGAGSAGVSDLNVTVWGQSVTLPFSQVNPYLAYLGYILVAVSFLLAVRIVARG